MNKIITLKDGCKTTFILMLALLSVLSMYTGCSDKATADVLEQGFLLPPDAAKPRVWWHWMNGNVTKEGIRADLEWMKRSGIGGFQNFDAGLETPQVVEKRLIFMTPEWKDAFLFTTKLADSLGLEMAIAGSPGWSESGGPWVKPNEAMKKYVWREIPVEGGKPFSGMLPKPYAVQGLFQNMGRTGEPEYYADVAVIAWRQPASDISLLELNPVVSSSGGKLNIADLTDGDLAHYTRLPYDSDGRNAWIQFEFPEPVTMQALSIRGDDGRGRRFLEAGNDGKTFSSVIDIPLGWLDHKTLSFKPVTAKYFRFVWTGASANQTSSATPNRAPPGINVSQLVLYSAGRVNRFEEKAAFARATDLYNAFTPAVQPDDVIKIADVVNITDKMDADGTLNWTPPAGKWTVMRLGYSLIGVKNHPASPEATGLEVDKLNAAHVTSYFTQYLDLYKNATQGLMGKKGLQYIVTDSWEAGPQNWTDHMMDEFKVRRGYDMTPWLPVLSGRIVESAGASDKFLWDYRKTLADLVTENHYDQLTVLLKERGMGRYTESHEVGRAFIGDGMEPKRNADVSMGAFWTARYGEKENEIAVVRQADLRESASAAHVYGLNLVAAESFTAHRVGPWWSWAPGSLKPAADYALFCGLNRFVYHTSVHQPIEKAPGLSLGQFGQWFTRHETWAEQAIAWTTYLARSCFMLQQGKFIADIAYYYGEDNNVTALFANSLPGIPEGYSYDFVNADALVRLMAVENGQITTPGGMRYRVLALDDNSRYMTLTVLRKIREMVENGAVVCGAQPVQSPSLVDDPADFDAIVQHLWAKNGANQIGKGKVYVDTPFANILKAENIAQDFSYRKTKDDTSMFFVHRKMDNIDIYWVANHNADVENIEATFRVDGREPEIWHPVTGVIEKASYVMENGMTLIPLRMEPYDAFFVVFRNKTNKKSFTAPTSTQTQLATVGGEWNVAFQAGRGAPDRIVFASLTPWNEYNDAGVKYFSGTATYTKKIQAPSEWFASGAQLWIDLGDVENLAEVAVNGKDLGIVWTKPFKVNATDALRQGENLLEIKVTNLWVNRFIGDRQPDADVKYTFTTFDPYDADSPLQPSGLLGPVVISRID